MSKFVKQAMAMAMLSAAGMTDDSIVSEHEKLKPGWWKNPKDPTQKSRIQKAQEK